MMGVVAFVVLILAMYVYYTYDPSYSIYFPKCMVFVLTGYRCPGCGVQRCVYQLLHGDIATALSYNYFAGLSLPYCFFLIVASWFREKTFMHKTWEVLTCRYTAGVYLMLYFSWWILRNILNI
jgi:hypothetical protein